MKKKIFGAALIAAMAVAAGWNFNQNKNEVELSDLALANVEALAQSESNIGTCTWVGCKMDFYTTCNVYTTWGGFVMSCPQMRS